MVADAVEQEEGEDALWKVVERDHGAFEGSDPDPGEVVAFWSGATGLRRVKRKDSITGHNGNLSTELLGRWHDGDGGNPH